MKFNFRKITSVLASVVMLGSTLGIAAAANYPIPFIQGGVGNVAIVVGAAGLLDYPAAGILNDYLTTELARQTATGGATSEGTIEGEAEPLFTSSSKIYVNDTLKNVISALTKTELPTVLKSGSFSGNVDATYTQTIELGSNPKVTFKRQPTSSDDPVFGLETSTTTANYIYNASVTFNKAVNLSHADSEGEDLELFGQKFTIASATDGVNLVLLKSAEKLNVDSNTPTSEVTIGGKTYTIELVSASDTAATIKVTDADGNSESKEISENASKKVQGITIAVINADETNLKLSASIVAGSEKLTFTDGSSVTRGETNTPIDGTYVKFTTNPSDLTKLVVSVVAPNSDSDAVKAGESFIDPVFGTFKLDFPGMSIADVSEAREDIKIAPSGDEKMELTMTDHRGKEKSFQWAINQTDKIYLQRDSDGRNITVFEYENTTRGDYVVVGNENEGYLLEVYTVTNQTSGFSDDQVIFKDVFSGDTYTTTITADGAGTVNIGGKVYDVKYMGSSTVSSDARSVRLDYPDSASGEAAIYPTIQTSKGAKVGLYEPVEITMNDWNGAGGTISKLKFPDGDDYEDITIARGGMQADWNITDGSSTKNLNLSANSGDSETVVIGNAFTFNFTATATANKTKIYLTEPDANGGNVLDPAIFIFEEKDDNNEYQGLVVTLEPGRTGDDGIGVEDVIRSFSADDASWESTMATDSKKTKEADLFGTIVLLDSSDSDQKTATISYPDEQVYAKLYMAEEGATITAGTATGGTVTELGYVVVQDSEYDKVKEKNLIVVGGSCVNSVAAKLLGITFPTCGAGWTTATGIAADQFLIKVLDNPDTTGKIAMLVAGYEKADTEKAVKYLKEQKPATTVGTSLKLQTATYSEVGAVTA